MYKPKDPPRSRLDSLSNNRITKEHQRYRQLKQAQLNNNKLNSKK